MSLQKKDKRNMSDYDVALVVNECRVIGEYRYAKSKVTQCDFEAKYTLEDKAGNTICTGTLIFTSPSGLREYVERNGTEWTQWY